MFLPDAETQNTFGDSVKVSITLFFDDCVTERRVVITILENQDDIGSLYKNNSPNYALLAQQTAAGNENTHQAYNVAIVDTVDIRNFLSDIDGGEHPRDAVNVFYDQNNYFDHHRVYKLVFRECVGD